MIEILIEIFLILITCIITNFIAYKFIRKMDKKERAKLHTRETKYYNELKEKYEEIHKEEETTEEDFINELDMFEDLNGND